MGRENGTSAVYDSVRLSGEISSYQKWLDEKAEVEYQLASKAKSMGLDFSREIEIPRAADLASRTEKLLEDYLKGLKIEDDLRELLESTDRESASIQIAVDVDCDFCVPILRMMTLTFMFFLLRHRNTF